MNNILKSYRALYGLKQQDVAKVLGITTPMYGLKERGKFEFKVKEIKMLVKLMNISNDDIVKLVLTNE